MSLGIPTKPATDNLQRTYMMNELVGFRFYPTEEELVSFYLRNKLDGQRHQDMQSVIPEVDIYSHEPWQLPDRAGDVCRGDSEQWFFFTGRQEREARGGRPSRTTASGYWKATGSPSYVYSSDNRVIGVKKTMVFYQGKAPTGKKTKWKMHEYRAIEATANHPADTSPPKLRHEFSLCRVYVISGSFRAFDRRPQEAVSRRPQLPDAGAAASTQFATMMEMTNSSSGTSTTMVDNSNLPDTGEGNSWEMVDDPERPSWGWEELDWP